MYFEEWMNVFLNFNSYFLKKSKSGKKIKVRKYKNRINERYLKNWQKKIKQNNKLKISK